MSDRYADLEAERHTPPPAPPASGTVNGPTAAYQAWLRQRGCTRKRAFGHQLEAREHILLVASNGGPALREYRCRFCDLWHLTSDVEGKKA